jgi:hypothetical protein
LRDRETEVVPLIANNQPESFGRRNYSNATMGTYL